MVDNQKNTDAARRFASAFAESLAGSMVQLLGVQWRFAVLDSPDPALHQEPSIHFKLTLDGGLRGQSFVQFSESHVATIASKILGRPNSALTDEHSEAMVKLISSAMDGVSASLSGNYGEFTVQVDTVEGAAFHGMHVVPLAVTEGEPSDTPVTICFDSELLAGLSRNAAGKEAIEAENPRVDPVNLKLVMDVELNVSLRFGQRQMPLRDVLELASGSVIELDRQVDEPVELLLDGKVIARGEAVIVDGNYGLRVTEIPQPIASHLLN
jgi:flagellar motor switch protein FliN/FliY